MYFYWPSQQLFLSVSLNPKAAIRGWQQFVVRGRAVGLRTRRTSVLGWQQFLCVGGSLVSVLVLLLLRDRSFELRCLRGACSALFSICLPRGF